MSIKFEGLDDVLDRLEKSIDPKEIEKALGRACALVERSAKQNAPSRLGELKRSITSKVENNGDTIMGIVYTPLFYAPYVEYGTGKEAEDGKGRKDVPWSYQDDEGNWHTTYGQEPQSFMRTALNENRAEILRILTEALTND